MRPDVNSPAFIMRDALLTRLKAVPTFSSIATWGTSPMRRPQREDIPYFAVHLMDETLTLDGDSGEPRFLHDVRIGFSVIIQNNNPAAAELNLDTAYWTIMNSLLTRPLWQRIVCDAPFEPFDIERVMRGYRKHVFGNTAHDNETPLAELQADLTFRIPWPFPPLITDSLNTVKVTVAYPWPYDPGAYDPPFTVQYDLTT
jgi:hypothetical protein